MAKSPRAFLVTSDPMSVRVRYAPSPTGSPHVGNIRTALFDSLFARHHGGVNILRIEDTDQARYVPGCEEEIEESLRWMGIEWQEGPDVGGPFAPYRQSERKALGIYDTWVEKLLSDGGAYWAFDTPEELAEMREYQTINKQPIGYYGGVWRDASSEASDAARAAGKPGVIRLRVPRNRTIVCQDAIRGRIEFDSNTVDDPVLIKGDGMPTYHFAAMVDDHLMEITHIIRGEEWISSVPKHSWLFESLGWEAPVFVHVPVIKGKDGSKLSKRHGDTALLDFRAAGYLPEAVANFIALIGWSPGGDRELLTQDELAEAFELSGLQPSPGIFDLEKLRWMNGHYIRQLTPDAMFQRVKGYVCSEVAAEYWNHPERSAEPARSALPLLAKALADEPMYAAETLKLEQERVLTLADFGPAAEFFLVELPAMDGAAVAKWFGQPHVSALFDRLLEALSSRSVISVEDSEAMVRTVAHDLGLEKLGQAVHPIRVALTGKTTGPGLFELMSVLGPERMVKRLTRARSLIP